MHYTVQTHSNGREAQFETELAMHSAGRHLALEDLNLDAGEIEIDSGRIKLDSGLRCTSNKAVFVAGDSAQHGPAPDARRHA